MRALLFDCDGVLVDTERDGHRVAFNQAFAAKGISAVWDEVLYGELLRVAGGKERISSYFDAWGWPEGVRDRDASVQDIHRLKTDLFMRIVESGRMPLRPGVSELVAEAAAQRIKLAVCSTSSERAVTLIVQTLLEPAARARFDLILAGDVVARKKPDPEIYELASTRLAAAPEDCVVIEDSANGLLAAKAAGMRCVITTSFYTAGEGFAGADAVFPALMQGPRRLVTVEYLKGLP
jgi:HAD superfamily hydrolase (TIGR01509 family)